MSEVGEEGVKIETKELFTEPLLLDFNSEKGFAKYKKALQSSEGRCLFLVHPFYQFYTKDLDKEWSEIEKEIENNKNLKDYLQKTQQLVENIRQAGIPIFIMIRAPIGHMYRTTKTNSLSIQKLEKQLKKFLNINNFKNIFYLVTEQGSPLPLLTRKEENSYIYINNLSTPQERNRQIISDFVHKLKNAGLKLALFAGSYFGGKAPWFEETYQGATYKPTYGPFATENWKLKDYYFEKRKGGPRRKHPFEIILPEGCLATAIRMFAYGGVDKIGITQATYPQTVPKTSQIEKIAPGIFKITK
jgi:hypothetical protein